MNSPVISHEPLVDSSDSVHVMPANGGWMVQRNGPDVECSEHRIQLSAIMIGRLLAESLNVELLIYGRDGNVRRRIDFSHTASRNP